MKLDKKCVELIAIGASLTANCQPCLEYHVNAARKHGADDGEIADAIAVGRMVRKGAQSKMDKFAAGFEQGAAGESAGSCGDTSCAG